MAKCEKCGADMLWTYGPTTSLIGGVVATLCARCRTEWNEFVTQHPAFQRLREISCVLASITHAQELHYVPAEVAGSSIHLREILKEMRECEATLHDAGLKWIGREN